MGENDHCNTDCQLSWLLLIAFNGNGILRRRETKQTRKMAKQNELEVKYQFYNELNEMKTKKKPMYISLKCVQNEKSKKKKATKQQHKNRL